MRRKRLAGRLAPREPLDLRGPGRRLLGRQLVLGRTRLKLVGVDHRKGTVVLEGKEGETVPWRPRQVGAKRGGVEVYRTEAMELRAGDRIRWTRNDTGLGLVNNDTAEVAEVRDGRVRFRLADGKTLELGRDDPQLHHPRI